MNCLGLLAVVAVGQLMITTRSHRIPVPPGPYRLPIIGNILSVPKHAVWKTYAEWAQMENSTSLLILHITHNKFFGQLSVVINTKKALKELYEGRSSVYADRPQFMTHKLMGWDFATPLMPYSDEWRIQRKIFHQTLHSRASPVHHPVQLEKAGLLMKSLYDEPHEFARHMRRYAASIALLIAYGYEIEPNDDHLIRVSEEALFILSHPLTAGELPVNAIPALRHLPQWFPGAGFKIRAKRCMELVTEKQNTPWEYVKHNMAKGTARHSVASSQLELNELRAGGMQGENNIKHALAVFFAGKPNLLRAAHRVLALVLHLVVQQRARLELDNVVGRGRLPTFEDRPLLPYVTAVCRETLRWQVALPLSLAHSPTRDGVYAGMFIPKGDVLVMWALSINSVQYPDPESFKPERFLTAEGILNKNEVQIASGLGRRNCVGMHMANATIWIMMASLLANFEISKVKHEHGNEIPVEIAYTDSIVRFIMYTTHSGIHG
ncbi:cytochrome P450 [Artomyces pyxidatus]|uniref:Cytochrome P450 n=1 Tax=Artomyces pyxidatus TaxID=48021 RepID=A0ACB8SZP6_9AGAM|nr:cytochrome P450 [Artomyces pyxidatus]